MSLQSDPGFVPPWVSVWGDFLRAEAAAAFCFQPRERGVGTGGLWRGSWSQDPLLPFKGLRGGGRRQGGRKGEGASPPTWGRGLNCGNRRGSIYSARAQWHSCLFFLRPAISSRKAPLQPRLFPAGRAGGGAERQPSAPPSRSASSDWQRRGFVAAAATATSRAARTGSGRSARLESSFSRGAASQHHDGAPGARASPPPPPPPPAGRPHREDPPR